MVDRNGNTSAATGPLSPNGETFRRGKPTVQRPANDHSLRLRRQFHNTYIALTALSAIDHNQTLKPLRSSGGYGMS
jgi:hypothetical protein